VQQIVRESEESGESTQMTLIKLIYADFLFHAKAQREEAKTQRRKLC
jgi:hypothetical protein